jgi:hypothetical protein
MGSRAAALLLLLVGMFVISCDQKAAPKDQHDPSPQDFMSSDLKPPASITRKLFAEWRSPRRGVSQAERMDNPVWQWMLDGEIGTFSATEHFKLGSALDLGPGWCSQRYGQSETLLPDGRVVLIAGEHEDYYDPDFFIYNDVIVINTDGSVHFYSYPKEEFPPTDFHSATLLNDEILLIGNLGYSDARRPGSTLIQKLNLENFYIEQIETSGEGPGWISRHEATLDPSGNKIVIIGGDISGEDGSLLENIDDWSLDLSTWQWARLTKRNWTRVEFAREDGGYIDLFEMRSAQEMKDSLGDNGLRKMEEDTKALLAEHGIEDEELLEALSESKRTESIFTPPNDPVLLASLYCPPLKFEDCSKEDEYDVFRISVSDVAVRYHEKGDYLVMTIEGELSQEVVGTLTEDLKTKLSKLLETEIKTRVH